jgi:hypothetical protein
MAASNSYFCWMSRRNMFAIVHWGVTTPFGLHLRYYQLALGYGEIKAPALDDDTIVIHLMSCFFG